MSKFQLAEETLGYVTAQDPSNADKKLLVGGSKNVLIDFQKKVKIRSGYTRLGERGFSNNLVGNGSFDGSAAGWTLETGWSYLNHEVSRSEEATETALTQEITLVDGDDYTVTFEAHGEGQLTVQIGDGAADNNNAVSDPDGEVSFVLTARVVTDDFITFFSDEFIGTIDNVRVEAVSSDTLDKPIRNAWTWYTSTGTQLPQRFYHDELEVYLGIVDEEEINAWVRVRAGWSVTEMLRAATFFDTTENLDEQIMVNGDDNLYEWNGAIAVVDSITGVTVTKKGTTTFAQNRFYTSANKTFVCVRTGTEYTYTGGESTTTLTGIGSTAGLEEGDILIQKIVVDDEEPAANRTNHFIFSLENQIYLGSEDDEEVYISTNDDYADFAFSSPRVPSEGALLTLDDPVRAFGPLGKLPIIFAGRSSAYRIEFEQLNVGAALVETLKVKKLDTGVDQGALNQESVVPIGNALAYLSNEVALRIIENPDDITGINPKTFSNPIKPDFDAEDWTNAFGIWYKNILLFSAPAASRMYMLNFVEDADGSLFRFWNPPQVLPAGPLSIIDSGDGSKLHMHSNSVAETYLLFDGASDGQYPDMDVSDKLPIHAVAKYAYQDFKNRAVLKTFDEYYVEGEITPNTTDLLLSINYDFEGATQIIEKTVDGSDEDILEGNLGNNSLAQQSLAVNPLGGLLNPPSDARKFRVVFEIAKEDFHTIQDVYETNEIDRYWAIIARGANATLSPRRSTIIRK